MEYQVLSGRHSVDPSLWQRVCSHPTSRQVLGAQQETAGQGMKEGDDETGSDCAGKSARTIYPSATLWSERNFWMRVFLSSFMACVSDMQSVLSTVAVALVEMDLPKSVHECITNWEFYFGHQRIIGMKLNRLERKKSDQGSWSLSHICLMDCEGTASELQMFWVFFLTLAYETNKNVEICIITQYRDSGRFIGTRNRKEKKIR